MKLKFFLITFFLLFARGCDFYSTSLWFFDNPNGEQNILFRWFGLGWTGLLVSNALIIGILIYCFYYYTFKYKISAVPATIDNLKDYVSVRYYGQAGMFYKVFYKIPQNKNTRLGHIGYVLIRVVIVASILATIHNLCQFYNVAFYNSFRELVVRPLYVIYSLIIAVLVYFQYRLWRQEFRVHQLKNI